jgi:hypothetical protein
MQSSEENVLNFLEKAREEQKMQNWLETLKLYNQAITYYIDDKEPNKTFEIYNIFTEIVPCMYDIEVIKDFTEIVNILLTSLNNGIRFFTQIGKKHEELELAANKLLFEALLDYSFDEAGKKLDIALEIYNQLDEIYSEKTDQENLLRIQINKMWILSLNTTYYEASSREIDGMVDYWYTIACKAWEISMEIGNIYYLLYSMNIVWNSFLFQQDWKKERRDRHSEIISKCEKTLKFIEKLNFTDSGLLAGFYGTIGGTYCEFGLKYCDNEIEQREYVDKGLKSFELSLDYSRKGRDMQPFTIIHSLNFINQYALLGGRFMYLRNRINDDLKEIEEAGEKIENLPPLMKGSIQFYRYYLPTFYYSNISQMSIFTPSQRVTYAKKAIESGLKCLKNMVSDSYVTVYPCASLNLSYSILARFNTLKEEQEKSVERMLHYANEANRIGMKYAMGQGLALGYSSLYRAQKTLANIAESEEERINSLTSAINAQEKYMNYATESRTGIITAQMRLGLLYEELGILTKNNHNLLKSEDILLEAISGSLERGYYSYAGTSYEYIARIEDRLGNHTSSAEYYLKAQENHNQSLKYIEYELLIKRIEEKIAYAQAWDLIEKAKAFHRNENHLKAKESYEKASKILQKISRYSFEGSYNTAWALLEEAEQSSKQEQQEQAIDKYKMAILAFEKAMEILGSAFKKAETQPERERIDKLQKVANIRIDYCNARINLEEAILLGRKGDHSTAAEKFAIAASVFRGVCTRYKLERERKELEAIYFLCRAWESMELAEKFEEPERFEYAANLFTRASSLFIDTKLKQLALGNSTFCQALEVGCKFDETFELKIKKDLYPKIKLMLSKAASSYGKGGFENVANWALATSIYFDAAWHLIQADQEFDISEKGRLLKIGSNYLKSALELFSKAGYANKVLEVQDRLNRVEKEESILFSALGTIEEPSISRSTIGISAPTCPIESSESPRLGEAQQFIEEEIRIMLKREEVPLAPQIAIEQPVLLLIIAQGGVLSFSYPFTEDLKLDDELISGFLSAFDTFSDELFSKGLDRAKFGDYSVVMDSFEDYSVCYLFKGQIIPAKQKLSRFSENIQKMKDICDILEKYSKTSQLLQIKEVPLLETLIKDIFIKKKVIKNN